MEQFILHMTMETTICICHGSGMGETTPIYTKILIVVYHKVI